VLAAMALVAVAIPTASGAGPFARAGSKQLCSHACQGAALFPRSALRATKLKPTKPKPPGPGKGSTCAGGSIAPGTYDSLTITGVCAVDSGIVKVKHNVNVKPNAALFAAFGDGPELAVRGNLKVGSNAVLVLGCQPETFTCINDPDQDVGTFTSKGTVYGSLKADNALAVIVHDSHIGHDVKVHGGGGGVNCDSQDILFGSPAYLTFEDTSVGGNVKIDHLQSCWAGFFRTTVDGSVKYTHNVLADPDGNEIETDVVRHNLDCSGNDPVAQPGDSEGFPNVVFGHATGECASLSGP
jgi:hypothetical protein